MDDFERLLASHPDKWLDALPNYQKNRLKAQLAAGQSPEDVANAWLTANIENTFPFGAQRSNDIFFKNILIEIEKFLCGSKEYDSDRQALKKNGNITYTYSVGFISASIAPSLGTSAAFIAPVIALPLISIGKVTLNAWCKLRLEIKDEEDNKS